jgi:hypothetical protein
MAKDCCANGLLYRRFYLALRTACMRHIENNPSDSTSNTHTHHAGMHFGYFVKAKSMLYGGHGVKREEAAGNAGKQPEFPHL